MDKRRKLHPKQDWTFVSKTKPAHSSLEVGLNQEAIEAPAIGYSYPWVLSYEYWEVIGEQGGTGSVSQPSVQVWLLGPHAFLRDLRLLEDIAAGSVKSWWVWTGLRITQAMVFTWHPWEDCVTRGWANFFLIINFWLHWSSLLHAVFSSCGKRGLLSSCSVWACHGGGFSCYRSQPLELWHMSLVAPWHVEFSWTKDQTCVPCIGQADS